MDSFTASPRHRVTASPLLRVVGEKFAEDRAIELEAGWNLVSFLPRQPVSVTQALQSIDGLYTAVLGFEQGALSYYTDVDPRLNTLHAMKPLFGYWIRMTQAGTLRYPATIQGNSGELRETQGNSGGTESPPSSPEFLHVPPTSTWVNFYGPVHLPVGTVVQATDPDGVACGATVVMYEGLYGFLACYGDDPTTPEDEGAQAGDVIRLVVDGQELGTGTWTEHGGRQWVPLGPTDLWRVWLPLVTLAR